MLTTLASSAARLGLAEVSTTTDSGANMVGVVGIKTWMPKCQPRLGLTDDSNH